MVTGRPGVTSLTINPVPVGRVPTDEAPSMARAGAGDVGAGVETGPITAVASGEGAAMGDGVGVDGPRVAVAIESDAEGSGELVTVGSDADGSGELVSVGSDADGNGDPVAIGSDADGNGDPVAIGSDAVGSGTIVAIGTEAEG